MGKEPLQWHPAFCSSLQIELAGEPLQFMNEYNLTRKPLQIDVLVIKKLSTRTVQKSIGKIFRKHNIVEFKGPEESLSVNDYYKVLGYASIYQSNTAKVMEIPPDEITMSFVVNQYPRKMVRVLGRKYRTRAIRMYDGIYYLTGLAFPTQIIVIKELSKKENRWLSRLRPGLSTKEDLNVLAEDYKDRQENPLYATCMDIIMRANPVSYKEGTVMCQALMELVDEWYGERLKREVKELAEECAKELAEELAEEFKEKETKKITEKAAQKASITTIINLICKKKKKMKSEEQIVDELEIEPKLVQQICQAIVELSEDASCDDIYLRWSEMFLAG